ncbi:MAG TPA: phosphohistidine phosphatase SixA [Candidatus Acidoferrum sp.]|nr:phosphohistidine phosphatase SixA [Candidatus Acidoferrum sp.]
MNLYLLRHGQAEPHNRQDAQRALVEAGRREIASVARRFAAKGITLTSCFYSPFVRTTQTCELFVHEAKLAVKPEPLAVLLPTHRALQVMEFLRTLDSQHVLLVTHNPLVSELLAVLTATDLDSMHIFATGELNAVHCDAVVHGGGTLQFRLDP